MRIPKTLKILTLLVVLTVGTMAYADTLVFQGSTAYNGGIFSLSVVNTTGTTYQITYTANFSAWTGGSLYMTGLNFNFGSNTWSNVSLLSTNAPGSSSYTNIVGGPLTGGGLSQNGCQTNTSSNFLCDQLSDAQFQSDPTTGQYTWTFQLTYSSPLTASDLAENHIGALFVNSTGQSQGILSQTATVPEPASLSFLGIALGGLALRRFRQR